jgi:hypothetical protein
LLRLLPVLRLLLMMMVGGAAAVLGRCAAERAPRRDGRTAGSARGPLRRCHGHYTRLEEHWRVHLGRGRPLAAGDPKSTSLFSCAAEAPVAWHRTYTIRCN